MTDSVPVCNHRVHEVVITFLISVIIGILTAVCLRALGAPLLAAVPVGGGSFGASFGAGVAALSYVRRPSA